MNTDNNDNDDNKKIVLSDKVQRDMLKFFLRTSIPRIKKNNAFLSEQQEKRGKKENGTE